MAAREIPGYYFDLEKGKYFKIMPNHAVKADSKYSRQNVAKNLAASKKRKNIENTISLERQQMVERCRLKSSSLYWQVGLEREIGNSGAIRHLQSKTARIWTSELRQMWRFATGTHFQSSCYDKSTGDRLLLDSLSPLVVNCRLSILPEQARNRGECLIGSSGPNSIAEIKCGPVTSMSFSESRLLCITSRGPDQDEVHFAMVKDPRDMSDEPPITIKKCAIPLLGEIHTSISKGSDEFVIGGSEYAGFFSSRRSEIITVRKSFKLDSPCVAMDWIGSNVIALGLRNGLIRVWDIRDRADAIRLAHPSRVCSLRQFDSHKLVVAGMGNSEGGGALTQYDLRKPATEKFVRSSSTYKNAGDRAAGGIIARLRDLTEPVLQYMPYNNHDRLRVGLDLHSALNMLAVTDDQDSIRFFDLTSGEPISSLDTRSSANPTFQISKSSQIGQITFSRNRDNDDQLVFMTERELTSLGTIE